MYLLEESQKNFGFKSLSLLDEEKMNRESMEAINEVGP